MCSGSAILVKGVGGTLPTELVQFSRVRLSKHEKLVNIHCFVFCLSVTVSQNIFVVCQGGDQGQPLSSELSDKNQSPPSVLWTELSFSELSKVHNVSFADFLRRPNIAGASE